MKWQDEVMVRWRFACFVVLGGASLAVVASCCRRGPLLPFIEGPYSAKSRKAVAARLFGTADLPPGGSRWRAFYLPDYDFQGDFDRWFRLDQVTEAELTRIEKAVSWGSSGRVPACDDERRFALVHPGPTRWWPASQSGLRLLRSEGLEGASGYCLWVDDARRRVYLYDWQF